MNNSTSGYILIVEDTQSLAMIYEQSLHQKGYQTQWAATGEKALDIFFRKAPTAVLLDLRLPDMTGMDILKTIRESDTNCAVLMVTGEASLDTAVDAMQMGADDFVAKPVDPERLHISLVNAIEKRALKKIVTSFEKTQRSHFCDFVGQSSSMQLVYRMIESAAVSNASVMITGESGTGKEVAARAIHQLSKRAGKNFVALNCAAIPHDLLESEIFGHVKGAFTGASISREGAALKANGGTLFLDELTEMPIALQSKLLRFIQEGRFSPVGSNDVIDVDIRFICATNRDPQNAVKEGFFREDLYYRLAVIPIDMPPLRTRGDDVLLVADAFLERANQSEKKHFKRFSPQAKHALKTYDWPGNVRELENIVRYAVVMNEGDEITAPMLSFSQREKPALASEKPQAIHPQPQQKGVFNDDDIMPMREMERLIIERALTLCEGNITVAAKKLDINPSTIHRKLKQWQSS